ncbi:Phytanoyl-CoA dioxygenase [Halococcus morrhuae DSM 1307]|uniref:Phytanoyl-CoA dioxygenase n=1 Tax=Halococcus morrhuae DSM 1307 TaxID=931277 RepID=M0MP84_HALMO|nr:phytanoyl-CoA dioxygenase family protein [Halococcus morrhuae]EMA47466.1 Phytanoyl-CoA dioxygenase [Halococcus morrhuae DSM 1307]
MSITDEQFERYQRDGYLVVEDVLTPDEVEYDTDIALAGNDYDESDTVSLPMDPGDVLFQHCLLPHYTAPNETDRWRRARSSRTCARGPGSPRTIGRSGSRATRSPATSSRGVSE